MSFKMDQRVVITIILCLTFLFAGWTAGSSLSYRKGYAEAERMQNITQIDSKTLKPETEALLKAARQARFDLLIRYKNDHIRDFVKLLSEHQKGSRIICNHYIEYSKDKDLTAYCNDKIIPQVYENREFLLTHLKNKGLY